MSFPDCVICKKPHEYDRVEALQILRKTPDTLRELLDGSSMEVITRQKGNAWTPRQILTHLVDTEITYGFRMRAIMGGNEPVLTTYDQNTWNETFTYGSLNAEQLVRAFTPLRRVNLEMLQNVDPALLDKKGKHPEYGMLTVAGLIPHMAAHDIGHLQQIRDRLQLV